MEEWIGGTPQDSLDERPLSSKKISEYVQKTFYGRTNRLYFKLCHDYCSYCIEYGLTENEQKCLSCLEEYSFDYWFCREWE